MAEFDDVKLGDDDFPEADLPGLPEQEPVPEPKGKQPEPKPQAEEKGKEEKDKTPKRNYIILQEEILEDGIKAYFEVAKVEDANGANALRKGFRLLLDAGKVTDGGVFVAVSERVWNPVPVKAATRERVAITVG
jgi:hypothetical protein